VERFKPMCSKETLLKWVRKFYSVFKGGKNSSELINLGRTDHILVLTRRKMCGNSGSAF